MIDARTTLLSMPFWAPPHVRSKLNLRSSTAQLVVALWLQHGYDPTALRALLLGALYPPLYWMLAASAALRSETVALVRGPREQRVVWDIPREAVEAEAASREPR